MVGDRMLHLGVTTGLRSESALFARFRPDEFPLTVTRSGSKPEIAREQTRGLIGGGVTHLLSFGFAGGLDPKLAPGTLLLPKIVLSESRELPVDAEWHKRAFALLKKDGLVTKPMLGLDLAVTAPESKLDLFASTGAVGVDMESHIVGKLALSAPRPLPFLVIRVVCDPAHATLPPAALACVTIEGSVSILKLLQSLILQPLQLPDLLKLGFYAGQARKRLLGCCRRGATTGFGIV